MKRILRNLREQVVRRLLHHRPDKLEQLMQENGFESRARSARRIQLLLEAMMKNGEMAGLSDQGRMNLLNARFIATLLGKDAMVQKDFVPLTEASVKRMRHESQQIWSGATLERRCQHSVSEWRGYEPPEPVA